MNDERPTHLDLFSGIGGFALAAQWAGFRTIGFCEIDKYCQKVLAKNFLADAEFDGCNWLSKRRGVAWRDVNRRLPQFERRDLAPALIRDIRELKGQQFSGISLITGGFPCQPFSVAGKRRGKEDDRHLWPEMLRVITEARPAWVLGENVAGIINMELDSVLSDLEAIGYATRTFAIPACAVDARHRRMRIWIVGRRTDDISASDSNSTVNRLEAVSDDSVLCEQTADSRNPGHLCSICVPPERWLPEPCVGRVAHGVSSRVDRLRGLGNAIVPQVAYQILKEIRKMIG